MPRFKSISTRIITLHVLALVAAAIALPLSMYFLLDTTATEFEYQTLRTHAKTIAQYFRVDANGREWLDLPPDIRAFYAHNFGGFAYSVLDESGNVISSSRYGVRKVFSSLHGAPEDDVIQFTEDGGTYFGTEIHGQRGTIPFTIQVTQNLEHPDVIVDDIVARFLGRIVWFIIPIILLVFLFDYLTVHNALRPVSLASERAKAVDHRRLDVRLPDSNLPHELQPLISAINGALGRLEKAFRQQHEFSAEVAHELRTPLAVLRLRIEELGNPEVAANLIAHVDRMAHVINQLLKFAELEGSSVASREHADLRLVCRQVAELMAPVAISEGKDLALDESSASVWVNGSSLMLHQAVRNLVENAIKHTAEGTAVEISVTADGVIGVADRGPGVSSEERDLVFKRLWHRSSAAGTGLGLAIVARIAELHRGSVRVENRDGGGALFVLDLAAARLSQSPPEQTA